MTSHAIPRSLAGIERVVGGARYRTSAAECLWWDSGPAGMSCTDFRYAVEGLFRTKSGSLFLAGAGGPMTRWSVAVGSNGRGGGRGIAPTDCEGAREWLEGCGCEELEVYRAAGIPVVEA